MEKLVNRIQSLEKDVKDINSLIDIINMIFDEKIEIIAERLDQERQYQFVVTRAKRSDFA